jgi:hypothetical protein
MPMFIVFNIADPNINNLGIKALLRSYWPLLANLDLGKIILG